MHLLVLLATRISILYPSGQFKSMLKSLHVVLGLSPVWNCYPKVGHMKGTT